MSSAFQIAMKDMGNLIEQANSKKKDSISNVINVRGYGALGDGITDDTAAIKKALAAIDGNAWVFFPAGEYIVSDEINIPSSNVLISGAGPATVIKAKGGISSIVLHLFKIQSKENVTIQDLVFDGNGTNQTGTKNTFLLFVNQSENIDILNCIFREGYGDMLVVHHSKKVFIDNNLFEKTYSSNTRDFMGCLIYTEQLAWEESRSIVSNNIFKDITFDALTISGQRTASIRIKYVTVDSNQFINCGHMQHDSLDPNQDAASIYLQDCDYVTVTGNLIDKTWGNGIDSLYGSNLTIMGNTINRSGNAGISLEQGSYCTITGNEITNNETKGPTALNIANGLLAAITVKTNYTNVVISNNILTDNQTVKTQQYAVYLFGTGLSNIHISDNYMRGNKETSPIFWQNNQETYRILNNEGFNQQGFGVTTPARPSGIGVSVRNLNPFPVTVYSAGGVGVSMQDAGGATRENIPGNPNIVTLEPFDFLYYMTTVPSSWLWYGH